MNPTSAEPELHLLLARNTFEEPLWRSLFRQLDDFFFPKKLPPLKLESEPNLSKIFGASTAIGKAAPSAQPVLKLSSLRSLS